MSGNTFNHAVFNVICSQQCSPTTVHRARLDKKTGKYVKATQILQALVITGYREISKIVAITTIWPPSKPLKWGVHIYHPPPQPSRPNMTICADLALDFLNRSYLALPLTFRVSYRLEQQGTKSTYGGLELWVLRITGFPIPIKAFVIWVKSPLLKTAINPVTHCQKGNRCKPVTGNIHHQQIAPRGCTSR